MRQLILLSTLLVSSVSASLCVTVPAQAQDDRIRQLERRVEQLEKRAATQAAPIADDKPGSARAGEWRNRANWRTLARGMSESDVRAIVGEPHKVDVNQYFIMWYWNYPSGPNAKFSAPSRQLDAWNEP